MSSEIVLAEPIQDIDERDLPSTSTGTRLNQRRWDNTASSSNGVTRSITYKDYDHYVPEPFESERLPLTLATEIRRFLRVANQIERQEPRVAYLCMFPLSVILF